MAKKLRFGYVYKIKGVRGKYRFAEPMHYADGCTIGDCWIVNKFGKISPKYDRSPVPFCASNLHKKRKIRTWSISTYG